MSKFKSDYNKATKESQIIIEQDNRLHILLTLPSWIKNDKELANEITEILNKHGKSIKVSF